MEHLAGKGDNAGLTKWRQGSGLTTVRVVHFMYSTVHSYELKCRQICIKLYTDMYSTVHSYVLNFTQLCTQL